MKQEDKILEYFEQLEKHNRHSWLKALSKNTIFNNFRIYIFKCTWNIHQENICLTTSINKFIKIEVINIWS